jgi:predicted cupin superfamily sugar epimerase
MVMMVDTEYWIEKLALLPHPEGGFYKETYRAKESISPDGLPVRFKGARSFSTAIYFLLRSQDRSMFHRIKSDELWHFHTGSALSIYVLNEQGLNVHKLGNNPENGESFQVIIPANCWFGAKVNEADTYTLVSCTVSPGFDFTDFELAERESLLKNYPDFGALIDMLTV